MTKEKQLFRSLIESNLKHKTKVLSEDNEKSEVDGVHILARAMGPAFFPDTTSRNNVHYPKEAWENAINGEEFQHRLKNRLVFGTIGHDPEITDNEVRKGEFSHIVTKVWIDEDNVGYAEYLVLNTEPGRILNTLLRAGVGISVSTKAYGTTIESSQEGIEIVDPDNFDMDRIDFVIDPGYLQAKPELKESIKTENINYNRNENEMDKTIDILDASAKRLEESNKNLQADVISAKTELAEAKATLSQYQANGSVQQVSESLALLDKYRVLGTPKQIRENLEQAEEVIDMLEDQVEDLTATIDQLKADTEKQPEVTESEDADELAKYRELGTVEEIKACLEKVEEMNAEQDTDESEKEVEENDESPLSDIGSPEEIRALVQEAEEADALLQQYQELGTVDELKEMCTRLEEYGEMDKEGAAEDLAEEYDVAPEVVKKLQDKGLNDDEIAEILDGLQNTVQGEDIEEDDEDEEDQDTPAQPEETKEVEEEDGSEDEDAFNVQKTVLGESRNSKALRARSRLRGRKVAESRRPAAKPAKNMLLAQLFSR